MDAKVPQIPWLASLWLHGNVFRTPSRHCCVVVGPYSKQSDLNIFHTTQIISYHCQLQIESTYEAQVW